MISKIDGATKLATFKPVAAEPQPKPETQQQNHAGANSVLGEMNMQASLLKFRVANYAAYKPTPPPVTSPRNLPPEDRQAIYEGKLIRQYEALRDQGPPTREDFKGLNGATAAYELREAQAYYQSELNRLSREAGPYLLKRNEEYARQTPTGRAIVDQARRQGTPVVVLPDSEYNQKFPGTAGVNYDGTIYLPVSSIDEPDDAGVLVHEYTHAVLGDAMRTDRPQSERIERMRDKFAQIGLDPSDGERLAQETAGWKDGVAAQHAATWLLGYDMERERAGLPFQSPEVRDELVKRAAQRELALALTRRQDAAKNGGAAYSDKQFVEDWLSTPQGRAAPPTGNTDAERAVNLRKHLEQYVNEEYVLAAT